VWNVDIGQRMLLFEVAHKHLEDIENSVHRLGAKESFLFQSWWPWSVCFGVVQYSAKALFLLLFDNILRV